MLKPKIRITFKYSCAPLPVWPQTVIVISSTAAKRPKPKATPKTCCRQCNPKAEDNKKRHISKPTSMILADSSTITTADVIPLKLNGLCFTSTVNPTQSSTPSTDTKISVASLRSAWWVEK